MNKYLKYSLGVIIVSVIGLAIYFLAVKPDAAMEHPKHKEWYTCSMHPQIIRDKPGLCPICGMALVKKVTQNHALAGNSIDNILKPSDNFIVGNYKTTTAKDTAVTSEINLPGILAYDPESSVSIAARISGRIEKIYVNYKYQKVSRGQKLFDLYSPELMTEQQNFIYLVTNDPENSSIIKASKQKLLLYGMTGNQINRLAAAKKTNPTVSVYSPANGLIQGTTSMAASPIAPMQNSNATPELLNLKTGDYIKKGEVVFKLLNTDKVWAVFNISQGDSGLIKTNQSISIISELDRNDTLTAKVNFIETQFSPADKTNKIRVYLNNNKLKMPIGLRLQGIVKTNPVKALWLQKQALVSIGTKKIVFIKVADGFKANEIKTGLEINGFIQIIEGISARDIIAENAQYLIDSESFIKTEKP